MKKIISLSVLIALSSSLIVTSYAATRLTGKSVIYDTKSKSYVVFLIDKHYREYTYRIKSKKNNTASQLIKKSFVNKSIMVDIKGNKITTNLMP